jgi:adenylate kinase family enzyme
LPTWRATSVVAAEGPSSPVATNMSHVVERQGAPQRILVYGVTGAGKTTLAARLAAVTGLPWHSVDDLTWEVGWVPVPLDEQRRRIAAICAGNRWILDTAYSQWLDVPLARAELVVGLDYSRAVSLARLVRRSVSRALDKRPICNGNVGTWRSMFAKDSILRWHFRSFAGKRARMRAWTTDPAMPATILLQSPAGTERWVKATASAGSPMPISPMGGGLVRGPRVVDH